MCGNFKATLAAVTIAAGTLSLSPPAEAGVGYYYAAPSTYYAAPVYGGYYGNPGYGGLGYGGIGYGGIGYGGLGYSSYGYSSYQYGGLGYGGYGGSYYGGPGGSFGFSTGPRYRSAVPRYYGGYEPGYSSYGYSNYGYSPSYYSGRDFGASRFNSIYGVTNRHNSMYGFGW
ncbi:MAG: hypothetical protein H0T47_13210 [Planctomycetaceae bacterium]|nr:hypothetical protein [Planctomycetaceae bacterium]